MVVYRVCYNSGGSQIATVLAVQQEADHSVIILPGCLAELSSNLNMPKLLSDPKGSKAVDNVPNNCSKTTAQ